MINNATFTSLFNRETIIPPSVISPNLFFYSFSGEEHTCRHLIDYWFPKLEIDLVAALPFYLSLGVDLRSMRAFRLLRLFRLFKLARYNKAMKHFHQAFVIAKEELILFGAVALILLYLSSVGIYYFENEAQPEKFSSVFQSLWWSIATLTTVGYGDVYPITVGGKIFTFFILIVGLGLVAVPTGLIASALSEAKKQTQKTPEK